MDDEITKIRTDLSLALQSAEEYKTRYNLLSKDY